MKRWLLRAAGATLAVGVSLALFSAQTPEAPAFEVAALHLRAAPDGSPASPFGLGRWSDNSVSLRTLLGLAFDVRTFVGVPDWALYEFYAIAVKAEDGVLLTREALRPRLRRFIEERFKLVTHVETRKVKGYALVVATGGPKLKISTQPNISAINSMTAMSGSSLRNRSLSMYWLARQIGTLIQEAVVNETALTEYYDVAITFAPVGVTDSPLPSLFTALQEQLGLRLINREGIPVRKDVA